MVNMCVEFASERNLKYGTNPVPEKSKTKCIAFSSKKSHLTNLRSVKLDGVPLPWVSNVKHLGNTLQSDNSMKIDMCLKRGKFIGKINSLLQEFHHINPYLLLKLIETYACSLYASSLWDLNSNDAEKLYKTWNVTVRNVLSLDRKTHRRLIEPMSGCVHLKTSLLSGYVKFYQTLRQSKKFSIRYLARNTGENLNSKMGKILVSIADELNVGMTDILDLSNKIVKQNLSYMRKENDWEINLGRELIQSRGNMHNTMEIPGFSDEEIQKMLETLCIS